MAEDSLVRWKKCPLDSTRPLSSFSIARSRGPPRPRDASLQGPTALGQGGLVREDYDDDDDDDADDEAITREVSQHLDRQRRLRDEHLRLKCATEDFRGFPEDSYRRSHRFPPTSYDRFMWVVD